jgi:outer membrane lipoprotein-sorting protein
MTKTLNAPFRILLALVCASLFLASCSQPQTVKDPTVNSLKTIIEDVRGATAYRYNVVDSAGNRMDTAKIIADPAGPLCL